MTRKSISKGMYIAEITIFWIATLHFVSFAMTDTLNNFYTHTMETLHEIKDGLIEWSIQILEQMGMLGLFLFSFTESLFHPIPVDPILVAMTAMGEWSMFDIFFWASIGSILGGWMAHFLGSHLGKPIFIKFFGEDKFSQGKAFMEKWGIWSVLIGAVTPIPYKVIAWMAGILHMPVWQFIIASAIGRMARFAFVLGAFQFIQKYFM